MPRLQEFEGKIGEGGRPQRPSSVIPNTPRGSGGRSPGADARREQTRRDDNGDKDRRLTGTRGGGVPANWRPGASHGSR